MENNSGTIATEVLRLLKSTYGKSMNRLYVLLIIVISMLAISIVDSIYQRCRIIKIIEEYERDCVQEVIELHEQD